MGLLVEFIWRLHFTALRAIGRGLEPAHAAFRKQRGVDARAGWKFQVQPPRLLDAAQGRCLQRVTLHSTLQYPAS
jgi:hypothetical protein